MIPVGRPRPKPSVPTDRPKLRPRPVAEKSIVLFAHQTPLVGLGLTCRAQSTDVYNMDWHSRLKHMGVIPAEIRLFL